MSNFQLNEMRIRRSVEIGCSRFLMGRFSIRVLFASLFAFLLASQSMAQETASQKSDVQSQIERIENNLCPSFQIQGQPVKSKSIDQRMKDLGISGVSVAVSHQDKILWAKGYGLADKAEKRPVDTRTLFLAGSISKPVAALRPLQLAEQNKLDLDANVNQYLSTWKVPDNEHTKNEKVSLRRILNHTAGLTVWGFPGYDKGDQIPTVPEVLDGKGNTDAVRVFREPGLAWQYSGGGYTVMQLLLTDFEKQPFPDLMDEHVLARLGMDQSTYQNPLPDEYHSIAATGYRTDGKEVEGKWPIYPEMAAAGLWTTPSQLILYAIEIQRILRTNQDGVITVETAKEMLKPGKNQHGLGPRSTEHTFEHGGADEGFRATLVAWKEQGFAVVVFVNSDNGKILSEVTQAVAAEYKLPGYEPTIKTPISIIESERKPLVGTYTASRGSFEVSLSNDGIRVKPIGTDQARDFLPESSDQFFDKASGMTIKFLQEDNEITGLKILGPNLTFQKSK